MEYNQTDEKRTEINLESCLNPCFNGIQSNACKTEMCWIEPLS